MHDKIKALKKENNDLRKTIAALEQNEADIIAEEERESQKLQEDHDAEKKTMIDTIKATKVELDKLMSTKLIIWRKSNLRQHGDSLVLKISIFQNG